MITSHPASHTCQNYDYYSRIFGGLSEFIDVPALFCGDPPPCLTRFESHRWRVTCAAGFRRM